MATNPKVEADPATQRLTDWLKQFSAGLTLEGRDEIAAMVSATVKEIKPSNWQLVGEASEADGITEGWITFETAVAFGEGIAWFRHTTLLCNYWRWSRWNWARCATAKVRRAHHHYREKRQSG